ncbi:hypothetical protein T310_9197, partial [Rasamsonia emersonii CBS 393.64]
SPTSATRATSSSPSSTSSPCPSSTSASPRRAACRLRPSTCSSQTAMASGPPSSASFATLRIRSIWLRFRRSCRSVRACGRRTRPLSMRRSGRWSRSSMSIWRSSHRLEGVGI